MKNAPSARIGMEGFWRVSAGQIFAVAKDGAGPLG